VATFATWANFCRPSSALKGKTPAMVSGLADHRWTTVEFVEACLAAESCEPPSPGPLASRVSIETPARNEHRTGDPTRQARGEERARCACEPREAPDRALRWSQLDLFADAPSTRRNRADRYPRRERSCGSSTSWTDDAVA
jgi:hypothetical protein